MNKIQSFKTFSQIKEEEKNQQLQEETKSKREQLVTKIAETLVEMDITSFDELSEEEKKTLVAKLFNEESKVKDTKTSDKDIEEGNDFIHAAAKAKADGKDEFEFNGKKYKVTLKADTGLKESYQLLITEATRWQFGKIDKRGNITSTYVHYDGYPDAVIPNLNSYDSKGVDKVLKDAEMGGMSTLSENPKQNKYYNDSKTSTLDSGDVKNIRKYLKHVSNEAGAEYVYLYDERDGQWYGADVFTDKKLKPVEQLDESAINEATDKKTLELIHTGLGKPKAMPNPVNIYRKWESIKKKYKLNDDALGDYFNTYFKKEYDMARKFYMSNESVVTEGNDFGGPGLIVVGKTRKDNDLIDQATEESGFYGIYNTQEDYWFFPEKGDQATIDKLENELETIFIKKGANVRYEAQYESVVTEGVSKIACLDCDEVNTEKAWKKNKGFCPSCKTSTQGVAESVTESFTDPLEGFPQSYKDLLNKLQKSNDRSERYMLINKMNVIRKKLNLKPLKNESVVTEGKDDFMARYGSANINLKKGYKHHTEEELNDLYDKLGDLVKTLRVKDVTLVFESEVSEAKGFKNTKDFEAFLKEIDSMSEAQIKKIMGKDYIDTPGFYEDEKDDYEDVIDFMMSNMGREEFNELKDWWESNVQESVVNEAEIKSDDEFKEYAFTVLQKAFGNDFDESKAEEVVDGLISKYSGDYGAMVGALQSSLN